MRSIRIITAFLLLFLIVNTDSLAQPSQHNNTPAIKNNTDNGAKELISQQNNKQDNKQNNKQDNEEITRLENEIFWLGLLAAVAFILPLPLGFYHITRVREIVAQATELELKLQEQKSKAAQIEPLLARNEKLESEIRQMQDRFRTTMKNTQEKHQEAIEKLKNDMHLLELENKRISGVLMLKEQVAKRSSPGT